MVKNQVGRPATKMHNRTKLITVACKRFNANGYDKLSMRAIATQKNLDPGLIHYYFKSKLGMFSRLKDNGLLDVNVILNMRIYSFSV
jgi:AcrR family transcriptional regulator